MKVRWDINVKPLCVICRHPPTAGPCEEYTSSSFQLVRFHPTCYRLFMATYEAPGELPTPADWQHLAEATIPSYICPRDDKHNVSTLILEGLFNKHAEKILQNVFRQDLLKKLPAEILLEICKVMGPCWYLTLLGETQRLMRTLTGGMEHQQDSLDLVQTRIVWISRITYRGVSYVSRLRDKPFNLTKSSDQIQLRIPSRIDRIVVSVDSIGIRAMHFLQDSSDAPPPDGSPWYEVLRVHDTDQKVFVDSNGLFIKRIHFGRQSRGVPYIWSSPCPPKVHLTNFHHRSRETLDNVRVHYIKFDPHVRGLLACCARFGLVGIHGLTDTLSTTSKAFVDLIYRRRPGGHKIWIYFPFNRQETIIAAWVRTFVDNKYMYCPPLVLLTSRGRTITFGPQFPSAEYGPYRYELLGGLRDGPISGIFHDGLNPPLIFEVDKSIGYHYDQGITYIRDIGVTCDNGASTESPTVLPTDIHMEPPAFAPDEGRPKDCWYMTAASLCDIAKVQVCRDTEQPHRPCLGLLVSYHDGHVEAIGQVRWDRDVSEEIDNPMYIVNAAINGHNYIKDVLGRVYASEFTWDGDTWQTLPTSGTIRWWFGKLGDRINIE